MADTSEPKERTTVFRENNAVSTLVSRGCSDEETLVGGPDLSQNGEIRKKK